MLKMLAGTHFTGRLARMGEATVVFYWFYSHISIELVEHSIRSFTFYF